MIRRCDALADFHSGSFHRTNLPQVRGDLSKPAGLALAISFGAPLLLDHPGGKGTLRHAAVDAGIPAILYEAGEPMRLQGGARHRRRAWPPARAPMIDVPDAPPVAPPPVYEASRWVRADSAGILHAEVMLGADVKPGDLLATVATPPLVRGSDDEQGDLDDERGISRGAVERDERPD